MEAFFSEMSLLTAFAAFAAAFAALYFGLGTTAWLASTRLLPRGELGKPLAARPLAPHQLRQEITQSSISIALFGGYGALTVAGVQAGWWQVSWHRPGPLVLLEVVALVLWNELHFYAIHRALHTRWLFRVVHVVHHRAVRPTPFSTYAMHPVEAILLGSVLVLILPFHAFSWLSLIVFPLVSLLFNNLGHFNHDLAPGRSAWHPLTASRRHERHHRDLRGNFGFMLPWLDRALGTALDERPGPSGAPFKP